jgi:murein biosynthesis integral membrane protein MurJ/undecaprenyldiphospho-muramoylpentapeptide beta-N-acetylglucosaminyltransferase
MDRLRIVFTGGGTGGHVYPNIAIYEALREKFPESVCLYIGTKRGAEARILRNLPQPMDFITVMSRGLPQRIKSIGTLWSLIHILFGTIKSFFVLRRFKPDIVIGSGGYVAAPVLLAAALLRKKVFIHEQNAVPGRMNRVIARVAQRIGVTFPSSVDYFPPGRVAVTGYPLRRSITQLTDPKTVREKYRIPENNRVLFFCGGSSGARTINRAAAEIMPPLLAHENMTVILSTGRGYSKEYKAYDDTMALLQKLGISSEIEGRLIVQEYFDNIDEIYSISDLIVSRAGAGSLKEITTLGIPSILVPKIDLPGDHQILNAREIQKQGGARIVFEQVYSIHGKRTIFVPEVELLRTIEEMFSQPGLLETMRVRLQQMDREDSTDRILDEVIQIVEGRTGSEQKEVRIYYLQNEESEKTHELIFDSTTLGTSHLCDVVLDEVSEEVIFRVKNLQNDERLILKRVKGSLLLNGETVENLAEIGQDDRLSAGGTDYVLKSYTEKVALVQPNKSTASKIWGSSLGIMVSRVGGFLREVVFAAVFGAGKAMSLFAVGLTVSNFFRRVVAENALENAFLPIFLRLFHRGARKKTWQASASIINVTMLLALAFTAAGILATPLLVDLLFPTFEARGMGGEAVNMIRLMFPYLFLVTIAAILATYLKAFNRFGIAESSAIFFSLGTVAAVLLLKNVIGIYSLAVGVLLGGLMQIVFLLPVFVRVVGPKSVGFTYKPAIQFASPPNKKYYSQVAPITLDVVLANTSEIVAQILASGLMTGAIAFLYFAKAIFRLPFGVISQAINTVVLKEFSDKIALFDKEKARRLFIDGIKTNLFLLTPFSIFMIVMAQSIVMLVYGRGNFESTHVSNTALALQFYSIGLIGWGVHSFTVRIFSARMDIKTSMVLNFFMLLLNITLCFLLIKTPLTFAGLALATSIAYLVFSVIRVAVLKKKLQTEYIFVGYREIGVSLVKTLAASLLMLIVLIESKLIFDRIEIGSVFIKHSLLLVSMLFIGTSVYFLTSLMLKNTEILIFRRRRRGKGKAVPPSLLSPFRFLERISKNPEAYREDFLYKINIYLASENWEVRNVGVKLIGLFQDRSKESLLVEALRSKNEPGFIKRNAVISLRQLQTWPGAMNDLLPVLLDDPYYEVRAAVLRYMGEHMDRVDYSALREPIFKKLKHATIEEKIACLRLVGKVGDREDLKRLSGFYLSGNSLLREELVEVIHAYFKRGLLSEEEAEEHLGRVLITSNNMNPEFRLKRMMSNIFKELDRS